MMQRVLWSRISRTVASKAKTHFNDPFARSLFSAVSTTTQKSQPLPLKWGSLGCCRMSSKFATGFNPLQPKPLDSIVDVQRLKDRYPDDIASIWDDVMYHFLYFNSITLYQMVFIIDLLFDLSTLCVCVCVWLCVCVCEAGSKNSWHPWINSLIKHLL